MKKIIVYSVNINGYDEIITPKKYDPNVRYILFTDNKTFTSNVWETFPVDIEVKSKDLRKKSRYFKVNSHLVLPEHDISIYVDSNLEPKFKDVGRMLDELSFENNNLMAYRHRTRKCIFDEANSVIKLKLDNPATVSEQMKRYLNMGFPENYGLFENGFLIRKNNLKIKHFNEFWWNEIKNNSGRDQLSQMFACWYCDIYPKPIEIGHDIYNNDFLEKPVNHILTVRV